MLWISERENGFSGLKKNFGEIVEERFLFWK